MRVHPIIAIANVHAPVAFQPGQRHEQFGWPMVQKQMLEAMDGIRVRDDPITTRAGNKAPMTVTTVPVVNFYRPEKFLCVSTTIVLEEKHWRH